MAHHIPHPSPCWNLTPDGVLIIFRSEELRALRQPTGNPADANMMLLICTLVALARARSCSRPEPRLGEPRIRHLL